MAKRLRKLHQEDVRKKIQTSQIINRLAKHIDGDIELTSSQVTSAKILLDRTLPVLSQTQLSGDEDNPLAITEITRTVVDPK